MAALIDNLKAFCLFSFFCISSHITEYLVFTQIYIVLVHSSPEQAAVQQLTTWCHLNILKMMVLRKHRTLLSGKD